MVENNVLRSSSNLSIFRVVNDTGHNCPVYFGSKSLLRSFIVLLYNSFNISVRSKAYVSELLLVGMGYKFIRISNNVLRVNLGYSHEVYVLVDPYDVSFYIFKRYLGLFGYDKLSLSLLSSRLKSLRVPDVYKNKGVRYLGEFLHRKRGKQRQQR